MNMNILFMFMFTTYSNRTSMCRFRFGPKTPEHEPNRTVAILVLNAVGYAQIVELAYISTQSAYAIFPYLELCLIT